MKPRILRWTWMRSTRNKMKAPKGVSRKDGSLAVRL
jgi:hypothetical protein